MMLDPSFVLNLVILCGILSIVFAYITGVQILSASSGNARMKEIAGAIQIGARAYLNRQYKTIAIVGVVVLVAVVYLFSAWVGLGYFIGAFLSGIAGYAGMLISVQANVRTAEASRKSLAEGLKISFKSGALTGMLVAGLALLAIAVYYLILLELKIDEREISNALVALGFGASLISIFARLGGGIFTKGADVGADLVGKVEAGIPEDDPRNPAVIADNVGDNVGDCAGMAADLFETYAVTIVATMVLASIFFSGNLNMLIYPLAIAGSCLITSIIGTYFVRLGASKSIMGALYKGFIVSAVLSLAILYPVTEQVVGLTKVYKVGTISFTGLKLYYCGVIGLVITGLLIWVTEYYTSTSYNPVKSIAKSSTTGHGTNVIQGLAISMEATAIPALIIVVGILSTYLIAGLYGIAIAVTTMLALTGMVVALDAYGPVTDNAGGIAQMSNLPASVRKVTDALDAVGNTTKAITKGYAIGSAGLGALVLFAAYTEDIKHFSKTSGSALKGIVVNFDLSNPYVVIGLLIGGLLPYLFASMGMQAVGRAGGAVVIEVRRQFKKWPGIMKNKQKPDYRNAVDILTKAAIKEMIIPSLLPVLSPIVLYVVIYKIAGTSSALSALGAMLLGVIVTGFFLAVSMTAGGGAWDNAKKYIEDGHHGGKGSDAHKAAVTGDTVGDPYKDTAGPAVNPMIKITNIVALLLLAIIAR
ncbi:MAG: sodium-translocating pyrophosphatase [Proteobacteria bacterium]|nr:sodium-translocating pyrophosphatase [Candidatus Fonsibacter lacus]NBQ46192.1 sodium-translocating pyrophosphatase [Pseudomonadota bacterium]NBV39747.1 sodium-translocating pyrophosphatase [Candidatus Fonsibacter lacus]NCU70802.1 sodium-translocating pyrophosphatase [Candidatus Fonsibacter lacus]NDB48700.1 sodium-translocating pyrophosphatase [Pseudomonadota bacterium]